MTMTLIATQTVGAGGVASISFSSIPSIYTDLQINLFTRCDEATDGRTILMSLNGSSASFTSRVLEAYGTSVSSASTTNGGIGITTGANNTSNTFSSTTAYLPNYSSSSNKTFSCESAIENNSTFAYRQLIAGMWANTATITSLSLSVFNGSNFVQYSTVSLYGITKGSGGATVS
jgi:hypothetical protein